MIFTKKTYDVAIRKKLDYILRFPTLSHPSIRRHVHMLDLLLERQLQEGYRD